MYLRLSVASLVLHEAFLQFISCCFWLPMQFIFFYFPFSFVISVFNFIFSYCFIFSNVYFFVVSVKVIFSWLSYHGMLAVSRTQSIRTVLVVFVIQLRTVCPNSLYFDCSFPAIENHSREFLSYQNWHRQFRCKTFIIPKIEKAWFWPWSCSLLQGRFLLQLWLSSSWQMLWLPFESSLIMTLVISVVSA